MIDTLYVVAVPLALAIVEIFHPMPHDLFQLPLGQWLGVHYAQMFLFPAAALAMAKLVNGIRGPLASIVRIALFVFAVTYVSFDTAAGVVTGELVKAAQASGAPEAWRMAIYTIWEHPIVGGTGPAPALAMMGTVALLVAGMISAVVLKRAGQGWGPVLLMAACPWGLFLFRTHAWPGGPITFGLLSAAAGWTQWEKLRVQNPWVSP